MEIQKKVSVKESKLVIEVDSPELASAKVEVALDKVIDALVEATPTKWDDRLAPALKLLLNKIEVGG